MCSEEYENVENESWRCIKCHTSLNNTFHLYNVSTSNHFYTLSSVPGDDSVFDRSTISLSSPGMPLRHSSLQSSQASGDGTKTSSGDSTRILPNKGSNLRISVININSARNRKAELEHISEYVKPDLILMTETKIDSSISAAEFLPDDYKCCARKDRDRNGGGVLVAARKHLDVVNVDICENEAETVWTKIVIKGQDPIVAGCFYRTNSEHTVEQVDELDKVLNFIQDEHNKSDKTTIILGGDFNVPWIDWENGSISPDCSNKSMCTRLLEILSDYYLHQMQLKPTRQDSVLDLFMTNKPALVKEVSVLPGISDHDIVVVDTKHRMDINRKAPRNIKQWSKADWERIKTDTVNYQQTFLQEATERSVEENYSHFQNFMNTIMKKYVPEKPASSRRNLPWITPGVRRMCKKKQSLYNKARRSHRPRD